jgi:plastocyanin
MVFALEAKSMRALLLSAVFALILAFPAAAAELSVSLKTAGGQPVRDAVVSFMPSGGAPAPKPEGRYEMAQENIQFTPFVLIVPVGADVTFPNHDKVRHHVYSFSPVKRFELKLYGHEEARTIRFDKPGIVALGCNIHDRMSAYIDVVDTPYAAKSDEAGEVVLKNLPPGGGVLTIWQPYLKAPGNAERHPISISAQGRNRQSFGLDLRPAPVPAPMPGM